MLRRCAYSHGMLYAMSSRHYTDRQAYFHLRTSKVLKLSRTSQVRPRWAGSMDSEGSRQVGSASMYGII